MILIVTYSLRIVELQSFIIKFNLITNPTSYTYVVRLTRGFDLKEKGNPQSDEYECKFEVSISILQTEDYINAII